MHRKNVWKISAGTEFPYFNPSCYICETIRSFIWFSHAFYFKSFNDELDKCSRDWECLLLNILHHACTEKAINGKY